MNVVSPATVGGGELDGVSSSHGDLQAVFVAGLFDEGEGVHGGCFAVSVDLPNGKKVINKFFFIGTKSFVIGFIIIIIKATNCKCSKCEGGHWWGREANFRHTIWVPVMDWMVNFGYFLWVKIEANRSFQFYKCHDLINVLSLLLI